MYGYDELVRRISPTTLTLLTVDEDDYQGSSLSLIRDGDRFGYLRYGWGSCSGCDAYQAAEGDEVELAELAEGLARDIHWEADAYALAYWLAHRDWDLQWEGSLIWAFVPRALEILAEHAGRPVPQLPAQS